MPRATLLCTEKDLYKYTNLSGNLDVDKIVPFIKTAQDEQVRPVLGTKLYEKIMDEIDGGTLAGNYLTLLTDFVQPMLIWYAMSDLYLFHGFDVSNAGILRNIPQDKDLPQMSDINALVQRARDKGDTYRKLLLKHLCYYPNLYPEYNADQEDGTYPNHDTTNFNPGINL